jgi:curved DNA-binding protein CbpA
MHYSAQPDPYTVLGVPRDATQAQIGVAFRALVRRYHPDTRNPAEAVRDAELRAVLAAYDVLRDPDLRSRHDSGHRPAPNPDAAPTEDPGEERPRAPWNPPRRPVPYYADPFYADPYFIRIVR